MAQGESPLVLKKENTPKFEHADRGDRGARRERGDRGDRGDRRERRDRRDKKKKSDPVTQGMERFHISVGKAHGVKPASIVQAISDVAGLSDKDIGRIELHDQFSFIELPFGMPKEVFNDLKKTKVSGEKLAISIVKNTASKPKFSKPKGKGKSKGGKKKRK
jgi:ATP-dependent RNA helicase DeaD